MKTADMFEVAQYLRTKLCITDDGWFIGCKIVKRKLCTSLEIEMERIVMSSLEMIIEYCQKHNFTFQINARDGHVCIEIS